MQVFAGYLLAMWKTLSQVRVKKDTQDTNLPTEGEHWAIKTTKICCRILKTRESEYALEPDKIHLPDTGGMLTSFVCMWYALDFGDHLVSLLHQT